MGSSLKLVESHSAKWTIRVTKYWDLFVTHGLFQLTQCPHDARNQIISWIKYFAQEPKQHVNFCEIESCISDHFRYISVFDILKTPRHTSKFLKINRSDETYFEAFYNEVISHIESKLPRIWEIILHATAKYHLKQFVLRCIDINHLNAWQMVLWFFLNIARSCLLS